MGVSVRCATDSDLRDLVQLLGREAGASWTPAQVTRFCSREAAEATGADHLGLVAMASERLLGCILLTRVLDEAEVIYVMVDSTARQRGIGRQLLGAALDLLCERGVKQCHLEVRASNGAARALYERQGFQQTGRRDGYYRSTEGRAEDALVMSRRLAGEDR